jgi:hypothetical protein
MSGSTPLRDYFNSSLATNFTLAHLLIAFLCLILAPLIEETEEKEICRHIILEHCLIICTEPIFRLCMDGRDAAMIR